MSEFLYVVLGLFVVTPACLWLINRLFPSRNQ